MSVFSCGRVVTIPCGNWSSTKVYECLSLVYNPTNGNSYIARKTVPAGTTLTDTDYWAISSEYSTQYANLAEDVETLKAQVAANVSASTDSDADYAAEVVDARVRYDRTTGESLGETLRGIDEDLQSGMINKLAFTSASVMADTSNIDSDATYVEWLSEGQHNFDFHWYKTGKSTTGYCYCFLRLSFGMTIED